MKYEVTAIAIDPQHPNLVSPARTEEIDTETNELFRDARGPWDVEDIYERFWNRFHDSWEHDFPSGKEKVKVISVVEL
jgi:hypothetical protein